MLTAKFLFCLLITVSGKIRNKFLLVGHTKFSPDRNFEVIKAKYAVTNVECLNDVVNAVAASLPKGFNKAVATIDPLTFKRVVPWSYWDTFLLRFLFLIPRNAAVRPFHLHKWNELLTKLFADEEELSVKLQVTSLETMEANVLENIVPD